MTSIEAIKRELIAEARRLDPADRSLKARASSLRQRWTGGFVNLIWPQLGIEFWPQVEARGLALREAGVR